MFSLGVVLVIWSYARAGAQPGIRATSGLLKIVAIIALSVCLLEPLISGTRPRPGANVMAIVVDNSQSMQIEDRGSAVGTGK